MKKIILILILSVSFLFAQTFNDAYRLGQQHIDYDARTLALGNSTIGALGSFSSTLINPAGIGTIRRDIFSLSINSDSYKNNTTFFGNVIEADKSSSNLSALSLIIPMNLNKGNVVFAFGFNQVQDFNSALKFDGFNNSNNSFIQFLTTRNDNMIFNLALSNRYQDSTGNTLDDETLINGRLNQSGETFESGSLNNWVISTGLEAGEKLYLGATINIISGDYLSNRVYREGDSKGLYQGLLDPSEPRTLDFDYWFLKDEVEWDLSGWDARFGLLYDVNENLSIGASVKFPTFYKVKERYKVEGESYFRDNIFAKKYDDYFSEYGVRTPMEFSGGFSASLMFVRLNAAATYTDHTQMKFENVGDNDALKDQNRTIQNSFTSTLNLNFGAEFTIPKPALKLRGGFMYLPSGFKEDDSSFDKKFITAGIGFPFSKSLIIDFAYAYGWWNNIGDNYNANVSRTYQEIERNKFIFSFSYAF